MDKNRQARQRKKKRLGKLATEYAAESSQLVDQLKSRVKAIKAPPPKNLVGQTNRPKSLSRDKRKSDKMGRFVVKGLVFDNEGLQDGLRKQYHLRGGVWSSSCRKWVFRSCVDNVR